LFGRAKLPPLRGDGTGHGSFCANIVPRDIRSSTNPCYAFQILLTTSAVVAEHVMT